jgi:hypothetical protein
MTNENLTSISAIEAFKLEKEIYKTVLKKLIDEEADQYFISILMKPELVKYLIDDAKYTEALDYVMHSYQEARSEIVREMRLKSFEKPLQGAIKEATFSSIPTSEAVELANPQNEEIRPAKDAATSFEENNEQDLNLDVRSQTNEILEEGAKEINGSLTEPAKLLAAEATRDFEKNMPVADVEIPSVSVLEKTKPIEEKELVDEDILDENLHEVKSTRETTSFFKKHKKVVLIASGLAVIAITSLALPTVIIPSIMSANSSLAVHAGPGAVTNVLHGLNSVLAKVAGATFEASSGMWTMANGAAINSASSASGMGIALGTYGLWAVYGKGFVNSIKNMFKAVEMETPKKENSDTLFSRASERLNSIINESDETKPFNDMTDEEFNELAKNIKEKKQDELNTDYSMKGAM